MIRLQETWVIVGGRVVAGGDRDEINRLLRDELERIGATDGGWRILFRRAVDGTLWELSYPQGEMQGGGPRALAQLDVTDPSDWT